MPDCKACGKWFATMEQCELCPTCERALERLRNYAAPVVHGRWNNMDGYKTRKVCSECGWDVPEYGKFYSYCPNCGAKMDGGADHA